ncbi:hypothetical protein ACT4MK_36955 [Bradyrhizobium barranii]|uniref:hypothetical protein n=1 Tax=Bradyrhizobium TaxID=374 RepID=UPI003F277268
MDNQKYAIRKAQRDGTVLLRGALDVDLVVALKRELLEGLARADALSAFHRCRQWTPLLGEEFRSARSLLVNSWFRSFSESLLGRPVFGVMVDGYRSVGDAGLHADAEWFDLVGVRFNWYVEPLARHQGALSLLLNSHHREIHDRLRGDKSLGHLMRTEAWDVAPGDVLAMDLRTWHFVQNDGSSRSFGSIFYYAIPQTPAEEAAIRNSAARNRRALKAFGRPNENLYPGSILNNPALFPAEWSALLRKYDFVDQA